MRISDLSSPADINKLKALLQSGQLSQDDLNQATISGSFGPQNALANMANGASAAGVADSSRVAARPDANPQFGDLDHELVATQDRALTPAEQLQKDILGAKFGDPDADARVRAYLDGQIRQQQQPPAGSNYVQNGQTGHVTYLTPQGLSDTPQYGATIQAPQTSQSPQAPKSVDVVGYVGGRRVNMGQSPQGPVDIDYTQPPLQLMGGAKAYYTKDDPSSAYVMKDGNPAQKVALQDQTAQLAYNKEMQDVALKNAQIAQSQASTSHTQEETRASKVNNPDWMGSEGSLGGADLSNVPPGILSQAQAIANGDAPLPSTRSGKLSPIAALAFQINPALKATDYQAKQATTKDFATGGKSGQVVQAINQALHHASTLSDAIDALNNSNAAPGIVNPIVNTFEQKVMGDVRQGNFSTAANALSEELKKIYAGGGGSLTELQNWQKSFDPNAGQEQQRSYLAQGMSLLQGAIQSRQEAYQRGMGPSADFGKLFTPQALEALQKLQSKGYFGGQQARPAQTASAPSIPAGAVAFLKSNPASRYDFDRKYGQGASASVLGQ